MLLGTELTGLVELLLAVLIAFVAAVVLGSVGFGFGLVSSPPMLLFLEAKTTIVIVNTLTAIVAAFILLTSWRHLDLRRSKGLIIGGLAGTPVGVFLLNVAEPAILRILIGVLIVVMGLLSLREIRLPYATFPGSGLLFGFITTLAVTAITIGGLLAGIYAIAQRWPAQTIRASLAATFMISGATQVALYAVSGLYSRGTLTVVGLLIPALIVGFGVAVLLVGRLNEQVFRYVVIALVVLGGSILLARELVNQFA